MARKHVGATLTSMMGAASIEQEEAEIEAAKSPRASSSPVYANPAVELAKQSIASESQETTKLIPSNQIRMSPISDRIDPGADLEELIESIRTDGQQVPIMCRRLPDGELEVVYGRRRLLACQALKRDVRTSIKSMTDEEAIIAQGLENNARENTSFIEKALFIMRILENGYKAVTVQRATGVNDTTISKMKTIISNIPEELILKIGPAHSAGRRQWDLLRTYCAAQGVEASLKIVKDIPSDIPSVERLNLALIKLKPAPKVSPSSDEAHTPPVSIKVRGETLTVKTQQKGYDDLLPFLEGELSKLIELWETKNKEKIKNQ